MANAPQPKLGWLPKTLLVGGFGFLPLWVAIAVVVAGSMEPNASHDYWAAAPWVIVAAIPASGLTVAAALATAVIFQRVSGDAARKTRVATTWFCIFVGLMVAGAFAAWTAYRLDEEDKAREEAAVLAFVKGHEAIARAAGGVRLASIRMSSRARGHDSRYAVTVMGKRTLYTVVEVAHDKGESRFILKCLSDKLDDGFGSDRTCRGMSPS